MISARLRTVRDYHSSVVERSREDRKTWLEFATILRPRTWKLEASVCRIIDRKRNEGRWSFVKVSRRSEESFEDETSRGEKIANTRGKSVRNALAYFVIWKGNHILSLCIMIRESWQRCTLATHRQEGRGEKATPSGRSRESDEVRECWREGKSERENGDGKGEKERDWEPIATEA